MIARGFCFAGIPQFEILAAVDVVEDFRGEAKFDDVVDPWLQKRPGNFPHGAIRPEEVEEYVGVDGDEGFVKRQVG